MVCVEVSPLPEPGQTAEATYTTVDGSALGMNMTIIL